MVNFVISVGNDEYIKLNDLARKKKLTPRELARSIIVEWIKREVME